MKRIGPQFASKGMTSRTRTEAPENCCDAAGFLAGFRYWNGDEWIFMEFPSEGTWVVVIENGVPRFANPT